MAKIHTHYDNLKVSRHAPQEVIRAAYKALSQKYHPDKNPGDERAARIMAIVNTAYNILSEPIRRKEHDDWIASEEWEVEWLESSHEDGRAGPRGEAHWEPRPVESPSRWRFLLAPRWWGGMLVFFAAGVALAVVLLDPPRVLPAALAWAGKPVATGAGNPRAPGAASDPLGTDTGNDGWARPAGQADAPPDIKALAVTQLVVPERAPDCDTDLQSQVSPNGDPWPAQSGYIDGFPVGNQGEEMQVLVDNSNNASPVLVKIYDLERRSNVRHGYVLGRSKFLFDKLSAGKYEVRYQNIVIGAARADCANGRRPPLRQAASQ